jgi:hypothetical protein
LLECKWNEFMYFFFKKGKKTQKFQHKYCFGNGQ